VSDATTSFPPEKRTRLTVLAPHPDDEALGAGGLIQQAIAAGVEVRVVFGTDGDNNPWPQRWVERRWTIDEDCRRRLGALRRAEALRSLEVLGVPAAHAVFLGLPDAGLLRLWKRGDEAALGEFVRLFESQPPDVLIVPSVFDRHADHRGMFHYAQAALARCGIAPRQFSYLIHPGWLGGDFGSVVVHLTPDQQAAKLQAILCHESQTALSRGRFTSYARPVEVFCDEARAGGAA
jgi:LmbE family N-acetylglucosaminyl deacetylase